MRILAAVIAVLGGCSSPQKSPTPPPPSPSDGSTSTDVKCTDPKPAPDSVCQQDCGPPVPREADPIPGWRWVTPADAANRQQHGCPICLPPDALIATPAGDVAMSSLVVGSIVWSTDDAGRRIAVPVVRIGSTIAPPNHTLVALRLSDGREVAGSPGHPTADARTLGSLAIGDALDGSTVIAVVRRPYGAQRTYDLLPASPTRTYSANGVLLASTLH